MYKYLVYTILTGFIPGFYYGGDNNNTRCQKNDSGYGIPAIIQ